MKPRKRVPGLVLEDLTVQEDFSSRSALEKTSTAEPLESRRNETVKRAACDRGFPPVLYLPSYVLFCMKTV